MAQNKIKLNICGNEFSISTEEDVSYTLTLANDVNQKMNIIQKEGNLSIVKAAIITAMEYCNDSFKAEMETDKLRKQMKIYFQEASKLRADYDKAVKERDVLEKETALLRQKISELEANGGLKPHFENVSRPVKNGNTIIISDSGLAESAEDSDGDFFNDNNTVNNNE